MRTQKYQATTRSARCNHCPFSKWVRAKANSSPQKRTSSVDRADEARAAGAGERTEARKPRRPATKWLGGVQAKWAVLSLVFYLKDNF